MSASKPKIVFPLILIVAIIGLIPIPLIDLVSHSGGNDNDSQISIDGNGTSVYIVLILSMVSSLILFIVLCLVFKNLSLAGVLFSILLAQIIVLPISQVIGPVLGVLLGGIAGVATFIILTKTNLLHT